MAGHLYYVPSREKTLGRSDLVKIGFPFYDNAILPGAHVMNCGPDGSMGFVFQLKGQTNPLAKSPAIGYYKETQKWQCAGKYWIGWEVASPPKAVDLERRLSQEGHPVCFRDGSTWIVPAIRQASGLNTLPQVWALDESGGNCAITAPEHAALWEKACLLFDFYSGDETTVKTMELTYDETMAMAGSAMAVNYFMGEKELRARHLCGDDQLLLIGEAIVDMPEFKKVQDALDIKKNLAAQAIAT